MSDTLSANTPQHIAIIMDGNGRWAQNRGHNRFFGHIRGTKVAKKIIEECARLKISHLTLYAFSTENWHRPEAEVSFLMTLLSKYLNKERQNLIDYNVQFNCIGQLDRLPAVARQEIMKTITATQNNTGLKLSFALSYGGRQEIVNAAKAFARDVIENQTQVDALTIESFNKYLNTYPNPDPDMIIRTSGESRLSNFLPWQSVYSEIYITPTLWPDFTINDLYAAIRHYSTRERRFGLVKAAAPVVAAKTL